MTPVPWRPLTALLGLLGPGAHAASPGGAPAERPDIVVVLVDDLRWDDLGATGHPFARTPHLDRIAREGVTFRNAFAVTVICSPSRANILTGRHTRAHGIIDNTDRSAASHRLDTFPRWLQAAGYETAFIGKWHMGNDDSRRPGFDRWAGLKGQGSSFDPELNVDGTTLPERGHVTDVLTRHAAAFLRGPRSRPRLLFLAHKALHPDTVQHADGSLSDPGASRFLPAERHAGLHAGERIPRRPNALEAPRGKPALLRPVPGLEPLSPRTGSSDDAILGRLRMLAGVDEGMGELLRALEETGRLERTLIVVTSDQGYWHGEHGLSVERRLAYEEGIRIPLLARWPGVIAAGTRRRQMVLTLDLAPTFAEVAGATAPAGLHGRSLVPLLQEDGPALRDAFLVEHFSDTVFPRTRGLGYRAIRTEHWKLIRYTEHAEADELYDLNRDPFEMRNLAAAPGAAAELARLRTELDRLAAAARPGP